MICTVATGQVKIAKVAVSRWRTAAMVGTATSSQRSVTPMGAVTYFVRMVAKEGKAEEVQQLLLENPRRIEQGEPR
jgi:hypothetical protein